MTPLRQRMVEDMQVRNLSANTQRVYALQVSLFARHFGRSPEGLGVDDIRAYLIYLTTGKKLAPESIIIATAALRFLYNVTLDKDWRMGAVLPIPRKPQTLPIVLSPEEVVHFLGCVPNLKHRTILTTCYAAGLRISEALSLKPTHIDSQRMVIRIEQGKGSKDRYVMLSPRLLEILRQWWRCAKPKEWLFPGRPPGQHLTTYTLVQVCQDVHKRSGLSKPVTPHSLRHAFAVHLLDWAASTPARSPRYSRGLVECWGWRRPPVIFGLNAADIEPGIRTPPGEFVRVPARSRRRRILSSYAECFAR